MGLHEGEIVELNAGLGQGVPPGFRAALELDDVALRHGQEILRMGGGPEGDRALHPKRRFGIGKDQRGGAIGDERAIGALQGTCDVGVLLALGAAELEAQILAHLRVRIVDAVLVVLGGDHRQRIGLIAMALEVGARDLAEHAGEPARRATVLGQIGGLEKNVADLRPRRLRHLLDADHQHGLGALGLDGLDRLMHGGRSRRAGILDAGRRLEAELVIGLEDQGGGEILSGEAAVEMAEDHLVDVLRPKARVIQRLVGDADDQALDGLGVELAEGSMGPADDAGSHGCLLVDCIFG